MSVDLMLWWLAFLLTAGLIPAVVIAYLFFPAQTRLRRTHGVIKRMDDVVATAPEDIKESLRQYTESTHDFIDDFYDGKNYVLPISFLTLVLVIGFFVIFSSAHPLYKLQVLDELLLAIPTSVFYGFVGGCFYALYSVVNRYRRADISSGLVLQLFYQILLSAGVAYFAVTLAPERTDPFVAFAVGFVPYGDLTSWLRQTAQTRLGTIRAPGARPKSGAPTGTEGGESGQQRPGTESLAELQGLAPAHRERLAEEEILTVQNLAFTNPLSLFLITSFRMSQIIDWIDQAYLRMYITGEAAGRLAPMGIRGIIELKQVNDYLNTLLEEDKEAFLQCLATALGKDKPCAQHVVTQIAEDPQVILLELMWTEFAGT